MFYMGSGNNTRDCGNLTEDVIVRTDYQEHSAHAGYHGSSAFTDVLQIGATKHDSFGYSSYNYGTTSHDFANECTYNNNFESIFRKDICNQQEKHGSFFNQAFSLTSNDSTASPLTSRSSISSVSSSYSFPENEDDFLKREEYIHFNEDTDQSFSYGDNPPFDLLNSYPNKLRGPNSVHTENHIYNSFENNLNRYNEEDLNLADPFLVPNTEIHPTYPFESHYYCAPSKIYSQEDHSSNLEIQIPSIISFANSSSIENYILSTENKDENKNDFKFHEDSSGLIPCSAASQSEGQNQFETEKGIVEHFESCVPESIRETKNEKGYARNTKQDRKSIAAASEKKMKPTKARLPRKPTKIETGRNKKRVQPRVTSRKQNRKKCAQAKHEICKDATGDGISEVTAEIHSPFICKHCGKSFPRKSNHDSHIRMHLTETPHKCRFCSRGFVRKSDMNRHERSLHLKTTFKCLGSYKGNKWGCGRLYSRKDGLRKHWKTPQGKECLTQFMILQGIQGNIENHEDIEKIIESTNLC